MAKNNPAYKIQIYRRIYTGPISFWIHSTLTSTHTHTNRPTDDRPNTTHQHTHTDIERRRTHTHGLLVQQQQQHMQIRYIVPCFTEREEKPSPAFPLMHK